MLHDFVYRVVEEVCWDREYLYRSFAEAFSGLMNEIYHQGGTEPEGCVLVNGVKSDVEARISWRLQHQLDFCGPNALSAEFEIRRRPSGHVTKAGSATFDLATGGEIRV